MARLGVSERGAGSGQVFGAHATATADDLRALRPPAERQLGVLAAGDARILAPAGDRQVAEVGVDAERQIGEVAQPREHPRDVVGRDAVDRQRADAHLLEAPGGATERVPLGPAPVLAVDSADSLAAAPEAEPDRQAGVEQRLDRRVGGAAHERERLEQDQIRPRLLERPRQQPDRLAAIAGVDVAVDAERDRDLALAAGVRSRVTRETDGAAREIHPVDGLEQARRAWVRRRAARSAAPRCSCRSRRSRRRCRSDGRP